MFRMSEDGNVISFTFSSEMHLVDRTIRICREYLNQFNVLRFSHFRLILRELLINAIEHGNENAVERTVICSVEYVGEWQFKIVVEDEGEGFDYKTLDMQMPDDPNQIRNRGFALVNAFTDRLEFNERGNRAITYISIPQTTKFRVEDDEGWQVITPSGDITASIADRFREILVELADQGHRKYRLNFTQVEDIDSVALSVMIIFAKMLDKRDEKRQLEIVNAGKALVDLFRMTRMDKTYRVIVGERAHFADRRNFV